MKYAFLEAEDVDIRILKDSKGKMARGERP